MNQLCNENSPIAVGIIIVNLSTEAKYFPLAVDASIHLQPKN